MAGTGLVRGHSPHFAGGGPSHMTSSAQYLPGKPYQPHLVWVPQKQTWRPWPRVPNKRLWWEQHSGGALREDHSVTTKEWPQPSGIPLSRKRQFTPPLVSWGTGSKTPEDTKYVTIQILGCSSLSYKMEWYLQITYTHLPVEFKSSLDYLWYLVQHKCYVNTCDKFRFCFSKLFEIFFPNAFDPRSVEFMDAEDWQLFPPVPSYKHRENQFSSITQSCPTLGDPMDCSTPGFPVNHQLPELAQTHIHQVCDAIQPSHPLLSASHPAVNLSQHQGLFQWVSSSHQVAKVLELQLQHQSFQWIFRTGFL